MRLLVTRPAEDAEPLASELAAAGHVVVPCPLVEIRRRAGTIDLDRVAGLLFTSANGVRALAAMTERRDLPAYAVGDRTAATARAAGFAAVESAEGDAGALGRLVRARHRPSDGVLLHAAGAERAGDLAGDLARDGYEVRTALLYDAVLAERLPDAARAALADGAVDGVLLFSPRAARHFAERLDREGLTVAASRLVAYCLSPAVAGGLGSLRFATVRVAAVPTREALLELVGSAKEESNLGR